MPGSMPLPVAMTQHEQILDMVLRPGSIEVGLRQVELLEYSYATSIISGIALDA